MSKINEFLYKIHRTSYYFTVGAFTSYGASALMFGICICLIFVTGAYTESLMMLFMGFFGPFVEAKAIVEVYKEGRRIVRKRRMMRKYTSSIDKRTCA
jgi:hypothetical protein